MKVLALIPARSGSKGVKDKNIKPFKGKPLMAHTIESALQSGVCDEVFVCTDSQEYADIAKSYGASVPFLRSKESAQDKSKSIDCVLESLSKFSSIGKNFDVLILLQPTSPLRNAMHIKMAYDKFIKFNCKGLVSVYKNKINPIFIRTIKKNQLCNIIQGQSTIRRQDLDQTYCINGAIYINLTCSLNPSTSFNDNPIPYIMPEKYSLDIDEEEDFLI
ncbi:MULTISPECIES: acylneuraminate cytidylyltransferase family protein [unclassified Helicobacter]|uniref:acylneuraminate cytidylyltransferase family protein n=1 Tax=unclassified Helicobacter TaxID=2593540 RepID=UPI000CF09BD1|nr:MULTISPECIES: acylneuraminate cytidylyltransferase family protein [unclassified Helicobacter]